MPVAKLDVTSRKPYGRGESFGESGAYEQIDGQVVFAVDPEHDANSEIVDLKLAPRDADGRVRFRSDFSLVKPVDESRGNGRLLVELTNRGRKLFGALNHAPALEGPSPGGDPGDGFLMRHGWTVASIGWQWDVIRQGGLLGFDAPLVFEDGLPVTGQSVVTFRPNVREHSALMANRLHQVYPAVNLNDPHAVLYVREYENGEDEQVPREAWRFAREAAGGSIVPSKEHLYLRDCFEPGKVYNLVYEAEGARVVGAGMLAFRDIASYLRNTLADGLISRPFDDAYGFGVSQTGRLVRQFLYHGLNLDEEGLQVFDGLLVHVAGARRGEFNHRFAQPSVQHTPGFGNAFPFADEDTVDPFSERTDGVLARQRQLGGVPRIIYTNTSAEYWRGDAALMHTDPTGEHDIEPAQETRVYHFAGTQHSAGAFPQKDYNPNEGTRGRYGFNLVDYVPLLRCALVNLDKWVSQGIQPPPSAYPSLGAGTLVEPSVALQPIARLPGSVVPEPARLGGVRELDLGPDASRGIARYPVKLGRAYPSLVPSVDSDGNESDGIRLPDLTVPVGTHTGWNPRHPETGAPEQIIAMMGTTRFFAPTPDARARNNDPRPSLAERYSSKEEYLSRVREAAEKLIEDRYVLDEDVELLVANASERYDYALAQGGA